MRIFIYMDYKKKYLKYKYKYLNLKGGNVEISFRKNDKKCDKIDLSTINYDNDIFFFPFDKNFENKIEIHGSVKLSISNLSDDVNLYKCYGNINIFKYKIYSKNENFFSVNNEIPNLEYDYKGQDEESRDGYNYIFDVISTKESLKYILEKKKCNY